MRSFSCGAHTIGALTCSAYHVADPNDNGELPTEAERHRRSSC